MDNIRIDHGALQAFADRAARDKVAPTVAALNRLLPGSIGQPAESLAPIVERIYRAGGLSVSPDVMQRTVDALSQGETVEIPAKGVFRGL